MRASSQSCLRLARDGTLNSTRRVRDRHVNGVFVLEPEAVDVEVKNVDVGHNKMNILHHRDETEHLLTDIVNDLRSIKEKLRTQRATCTKNTIPAVLSWNTYRRTLGEWWIERFQIRS